MFCMVMFQPPILTNRADPQRYVVASPSQVTRYALRRSSLLNRPTRHRIATDVLAGYKSFLVSNLSLRGGNEEAGGNASGLRGRASKRKRETHGKIKTKGRKHAADACDGEASAGDHNSHGQGITYERTGTSNDNKDYTSVSDDSDNTEEWDWGDAVESGDGDPAPDIGTHQGQQVLEEDSGFSLDAEPVWCGTDAPKDNAKPATKNEVPAQGLVTSDNQGRKEEDEDQVMFVSTDEADADVVIRRAEDTVADQGDEAAASTWNMPIEGTEYLDDEAYQPPVVDADKLEQFGWQPEWNPPKRQEPETAKTDEQEESDESEYHWGISSDCDDPGGEKPPLLDRIAEKVYNQTGSPFTTLRHDDGKVFVPKIQELMFPPCPTPGVPPEEGGALWFWDEYDDYKAVYKGRWRFNKTVDPENGYDLNELKEFAANMKQDIHTNVPWDKIMGHLKRNTTKKKSDHGAGPGTHRNASEVEGEQEGVAEEDEDDDSDERFFKAYDELRKYVADTFHADRDEVKYETDPDTYKDAEKLYPGVKQWLKRTPRVIPHASRHDAADWPDTGPPLEVLQAEYEPGGREAIYLTAKQRRRAMEINQDNSMVFEPVFLDLRPALEESGTNVSTWEECLDLGYVPGYPRMPADIRVDKPTNASMLHMSSDFSPFTPSEPADDGFFGPPQHDPYLPYFPRGFLRRKYRESQCRGARAAATKQEREEARRQDAVVACMSVKRKMLWCWVFVENEIDRMMASTDPVQRDIGASLRESSYETNYSPGIMRLYADAEDKIDSILERGEQPTFPDWVPSEEYCERQERLMKVYEARCDREKRIEAGEVPGSVVDEFEMLREAATPEERTRWPYVPLPHWTTDILEGHKRCGITVNETLRQRILEYQEEYYSKFTKQEQEEHSKGLSILNPNVTHYNELCDEASQKVLDIEQGRVPRPDDWPDDAACLRAVGIDPHSPLLPEQYGEGIDMWGPHPKTGKCHNTYCKYCYYSEWKGEPCDNPKFEGRLMSELTNDELHQLGANPYWTSMPRHVVPDFCEEEKRVAF